MSLQVFQQGYHRNAHGVFSCCSLRLEQLCLYFIQHHTIPNTVDCTNLFTDYKTPEDSNNCIDISHKFFYYSYEVQIPEESASIQNNILSYHVCLYRDIPFRKIIPFIRKFFNPSTIISNRISYIEQRYGLNYPTMVAVYYRGTDKSSETQLGSYNEYLERCNSLLIENSNLIFMIQTDEPGFEEYFLQNFPTNRLIVVREVEAERNYNQAINIIAMSFIISKCKHIICSSSNVSAWAILFRGDAQNVHQYLNGNFIKS